MALLLIWNDCTEIVVSEPRIRGAIHGPSREF